MTICLSIKNILFATFLMIGVHQSVQAQATNSRGEYIVDFEPFSPPEQDLINSFIGKNPTNFMSPDLSGKTHVLSKYIGQDIVLCFWSVEDPNSPKLFEYLNRLVKETDVTILTYAYENKETTASFLQNHKVDFPVMTNGKFIGEIGYANYLGTPRMFFISNGNNIKEVIPSSGFLNNENLYPLIMEIVDKAF